MKVVGGYTFGIRHVRLKGVPTTLTLDDARALIASLAEAITDADRLAIRAKSLNTGRAASDLMIND